MRFEFFSQFSGNAPGLEEMREAAKQAHRVLCVLQNLADGADHALKVAGFFR